MLPPKALFDFYNYGVRRLRGGYTIRLEPHCHAHTFCSVWRRNNYPGHDDAVSRAAPLKAVRILYGRAAFLPECVYSQLDSELSNQHRAP